jgi:membrane protein
MVVSAALSAVGAWAEDALPGGELIWSAVNFGVSLLIISALFSALFRLLPDVRLRWRDVRLGGFLTAVLFVIGKWAIGAYIGRSGVASGYGAAGSLIVVLVWVYYSSQILFFGAEFTRAWATRDGRRVEPKEGAIAFVSPVSAVSQAKRAAAKAARPEPAAAGRP